MDVGQTVYRGVLSASIDSGITHYITEAIWTGIEVDGRPMVKMHAMLFPADGFVATKDEALQQIVEKARDFIGRLEARIEQVESEVSACQPA